MRQPLPLLILTLLLASCTTSPTGQQQLLLFSEQEMAKLGDESFEEIKAQETLLPEGEVTAYVRCVTAPLTAQVGATCNYLKFSYFFYFWNNILSSC